MYLVIMKFAYNFYLNKSLTLKFKGVVAIFIIFLVNFSSFALFRCELVRWNVRIERESTHEFIRDAEISSLDVTRI